MRARLAFTALVAGLLPLAVLDSGAMAQKSVILKAPITGVLKAQPSPVAPIYRFRIDSFRIVKTRALHEDTDFVSLQLNNGAVQTKSMGDVNDGIHNVGLYIDMSVAPNASVKMSYLILNSGKTPDVVVNFLGGLTYNLGVLFGQNLGGLLEGGCDGLVAKGEHVFTAASLPASGATSGEDYTPGTDSATGCGSNSKYYVKWSVSHL